MIDGRYPYRHDMPFGAIPLTSGITRFNLWAPKAQSVHLCLSDGLAPLPLRQRDQGWFVLETQAPQGTRYHYLIDQKYCVPDPASRYQPENVHKDSQVIDPTSFSWGAVPWPGRSWREAILYEIHVGTFSPQGTYDGVTERLDHLANLGITALEIMPLADFPGRFGWGYDGVSLFAPCARYGHPDALKNLVLQAHLRGMMVFLDVVYNHFGPEGNYLHLYAPQFFHPQRHTPWGAAINFDGPDSPWVRRFFIDNALYWIQEFHFDGLRLDAVQTMIDHSPIHFLNELHQAIMSGPGQHRPIHLVLENGDNASRFLEPVRHSTIAAGRGQWNDDFHHSLHALATGESDGYYRDYFPDPIDHLGRCLQDGFSYQGEFSSYFGVHRGSPSAHLPGDCFIQFLQNHDQIGNRPMGERLHALVGSEVLHALTALFLLAPGIPMLFMGQEWGSLKPFFFFSDLESRLRSTVVSGRKREFLHFFRLSASDSPPTFADPSQEETFLFSKLDWSELLEMRHQDWITRHRELIHLRQKEIWPRMEYLQPGMTRVAVHPPGALYVAWPLASGETLHLCTNLSSVSLTLSYPPGRCIYATSELNNQPKSWLTAWFIQPSGWVQSDHRSLGDTGVHDRG
ncbi:MAG: malto-oligosyltrehalose trehalohydrolase [Magnetococcales bacterium]|nr:malto-oligosyltrehalose trehalohydrolase [Magnetococcales bacterium]